MHLLHASVIFRKPFFKAVLLLILIGLLAAPTSYAIDFEKFFTETLWSGLIWPFAQLLNFMVVVLIKVATYNGFANEPIVIKGWTLTRNLANMFFVFILLIIAIGTIVKWQVMNYRQNLRRLILMALLINFSRTITVFIIDLSQVIVLTFLTAVQDALQGGVITLLGIDTVISNAGSAIGGAAISVITFVIAAIMVLIAAIVVGVIVIVMVARIIALWIVIIMAPLAFLASTIPQTDKYYKQWWDILGKNAASGPILAFFLWLTFAVVADQGGVANPEDPSLGSAGAFLSIGGIDGTAILNFIVGIGMLVFSIRLAGQVGGAGGAMAAKFGDKGLGSLKNVGKFAAQRTAFGKSGEGGVVGRLKSVGLGVTAGIAGGIGSKLPKLAGRAGAEGAAATRLGRTAARLGTAVATVTGARSVARSVGRTARLAQERQMTVRTKAEEKSLEGLSPEEQRGILQEKPWYRAFMRASTPRRQAIINAQTKEINKKDDAGKYVMQANEVAGLDDELQRSGVTKQQLDQFRKATNLRSLKHATANKVAGAKDELDKLTIELHQEGKLSSDAAESNPELAGRLMFRTKSISQIKSWIKDMDSSAKDVVLEGYEKSLRQLAHDMNADPAVRADSEKQKDLKKFQDIIAGQDSSRAVGLVKDTQAEWKAAKARGVVKKDFVGMMDMNTVTSNADKPTYNQIISNSSFAGAVHEVDPAFVKNAIESPEVNAGNKQSLVEHMVTAANDANPEVHLPARRAISAALNHEQTRQQTQDYLNAAKASAPTGTDPTKVIYDYEDQQIQQKAQTTVKKELADNIERFEKKYTVDTEVLAPPGDAAVGTPEKAVPWFVAAFDKTTGEVTLKKTKAGGKTKKISLNDFSRLNKLF